jgi:hypothetical protein
MATIHPVRDVQSGLPYDFGSEWVDQMTFERRLRQWRISKQRAHGARG